MSPLAAVLTTIPMIDVYAASDLFPAGTDREGQKQIVKEATEPAPTRPQRWRTDPDRISSASKPSMTTRYATAPPAPVNRLLVSALPK